MLRLVHAFCEAAPMLLLQLHVLFKDTSVEPSELGVTPDPSIDEPSGRLSSNPDITQLTEPFSSTDVVKDD
jgi:hypothetical protein